MPNLKPLLCAATLALAMPMAALAQPAPPNDAPAANAPNIERRDDGPRWRDRDVRRDRLSDDERGQRWRDGHRFSVTGTTTASGVTGAATDALAKRRAAAIWPSAA